MSSDGLEAEARRLICITRLPTWEELEVVRRLGFCQHLNLMGTELREIYPGFRATEYCYTFSDIFSYGATPEIAAAEYLKASAPNDQAAFRTAVDQLLNNLRQAVPTHVFCYAGQGRSPVVTLTALAAHFAVSPQQAQSLTLRLRPQARLTSMSLSAALWYLDDVQ